MPIYEYQCPQCQHVFEEWMNINGAAQEVPCPDCTAMAPRIISNTAFVLKGGGWYVTEYGNRKSTSSAAETSKSAAAGSKSQEQSSATSTNKGTQAAPEKNTTNTQATATPSSAAPSPAANPVCSNTSKNTHTSQSAHA